MVNLTLKQYLSDRGFASLEDGFYIYISQWKQWYQGNVKRFHAYTAYNGRQKINCKRLSLQMAKKVCEDWANLLMNEKVAITVEGQKEQAFLDEILQKNNFLVKANEAQEWKAAFGTVAYVPYLQNVTVTPDGKVTGNTADIHINYITADNIYPLSWENGVIKECAFGSLKRQGNKEYYYVQLHILENGFYTIENILLDAKSGQIIENINSIKGFETVAPKIQTKSAYPQFVIDRLNIVNNIAVNNPMGISVFANSIDVLKAIDVVFDSYNSEFILGRKRIMVEEEALKIENQQMVFDPNEIVFYRLPAGIGENNNFVKEIDMSLRAQEHEIALQNKLNLLSAKCGFGENHYKFDGGSIATATQIVSENSTLFRTLKKHEIILEQAIIELVRILFRLGNQYLNLSLHVDAAVTIDFDDSIIEDRQTELNDMRLDVSSQIIKPIYYIMKKYKVDEQTAKEMMAEQYEVEDDA